MLFYLVRLWCLDSVEIKTIAIAGTSLNIQLVPPSFKWKLTSWQSKTNESEIRKERTSVRLRRCWVGKLDSFAGKSKAVGGEQHLALTTTW